MPSSELCIGVSLEQWIVALQRERKWSTLLVVQQTRTIAGIGVVNGTAGFGLSEHALIARESLPALVSRAKNESSALPVCEIVVQAGDSEPLSVCDRHG